MREEEDVEFREGVVYDKKVKEGRGSYVYVGQKKEVQIDVRLQAQSRVTVQIKSTHPGLRFSFFFCFACLFLCLMSLVRNGDVHACIGKGAAHLLHTVQ